MPDFDWEQFKAQVKDTFYALREVIESIQREEAAFTEDEKMIHRADMVARIAPLGISPIDLPATDEQETLESERERLAPREIEESKDLGIDEIVEEPIKNTGEIETP